MPIVSCPSGADLERLFQGGVPEPEAAALEQHILECRSCMAKLKALLPAEDTLEHALAGKDTLEIASADPELVKLTHKIKSLKPPLPSVNQGIAMLTFSCPSCQKKLSVKEESAGKKVKCPSCGQVIAAPAREAVAAGAPPAGAAAGVAEMPTSPPSPGPDSSAADKIIVPPTGETANQPTPPPASTSDLTNPSLPQAVVLDPSLTDFLTPPQTPDELGRLGKYRILKVLGHGGMGVVFQAEDPKLKRAVAIKAMLPTLAASATAGKRFMHEAEAMAKVEHDHVVRIYQVDEDRGVPFMAMEFLKGEPLDVRLQREEKLPIPEVMRLGREIAEALAAAHSTGLIHRDIKPGNIWLEAPRTRVKILDFGLARAAQQDSGLTQQGAIIGTPAYMAPEQGRGDQIDARCDLFSLGVVLYRIATGKQPFQGNDTVSTLMAVAMHDPAPPVELNPEVPLALSELVMKLLEKEPDKRTGSAQEVVDALRKMEKAWARMHEVHDATEALHLGAARPGASKSAPTAASSPAPISKSDGVQPRRSKRGLLVATGIFLALALVAAGIVFFWQTPSGLVRVEIDDDDVEVVLTKTGATIKKGDKAEYTLTPGSDHRIKVKRGDGFEFETKDFVVKKNEKTTLKIEVLPDKVIALADGKEIGSKELPPGRLAVGAAPPAARFALETNNNTKITFDKPVQFDPKLPNWCLEFSFLCRQPPDKGHHVLMGVSPGLGGPTLQLTAGKVFFQSQAKGLFNAIFAAKDPTPLGERVHAALVRDNKEIRLFLNGKLQKSGPLVEVDYGHAGSITIGGPNFLNGMLYAFRYSKVSRYSLNFTPAERFQNDADTLALYHFDKSDGDIVVRDASGNEHDGKIAGAKWVKVDGTAIAPAADFALKFDTAHNVQVPSLSLGKTTASVTVEAYVTLSKDSVARNHKVLGFVDALWLNAHVGNKANAGWSFARGGVSNASWVGTAPIVTDRRVHLAGVYSKDLISLYLDGKLIDSKARRSPLRQGTFFIGDGFQGTIDEVRISKVARYDKNFTPAQRFEPDADTLALYHCDEGEGDELKDSSGNGHHGKIAGAKWVKVDGTPIAPARMVTRHGLQFDGKGSHVTIETLRRDSNLPRTIEAYLTPATVNSESKFADGIVGYRGTAGTMSLLQHKDTWRGVGILNSEVRAINGAAGQVKVGVRTHVAAIWDGNGCRLFVNGQRVTMEGKTFTVTVDPDFNGTVLGAAITQKGLDRFWAGIMTEVRFSKGIRYEKDFTPAERFEPDTDTLALYHFDEGEGDVLKDSSGNGHDGKIVGAKWVKIDEPGALAPGDASPPTPAAGASPFDKVRREDISADKLKAAGLGDPAKAPAEIVAILGASQSKIDEDPVRMALSPDGKTVAVSSWKNDNVIFWDVETGKERVFASRVFEPLAMRFSNDGRLLAIHSRVGPDKIWLWDVATGKPYQTILKTATNVANLAFSPGDDLVYFTDNGMPKAENVKGRVPAGKLPAFDEKNRLATTGLLRLSQDGLVLVGAGVDQEKNISIRSWDALTGKFLRILSEKHQSVTSMTLSPNGKQLFFTRSYNTNAVRVLETATGKLLGEFREGKRGPGDIAVSPDCKLAATCYPDGAVYLWDTEFFRQQRVLHLNPPFSGPAGGGGIREVLFTPDSRHLITRNADGTVYVVRLSESPSPESKAAFTNSLGMEFALVPKGKSWLGGGGGKPGDKEVELVNDFYLGKYEVTQEEWTKVMGTNPSAFKAVAGIAKEDQQRFPVEQVSWHDAQSFLERLNKQCQEPGWTYRLAKDMEWEYACRGGPLADKSDSAFDFYLDTPTNRLPPDQANFGRALDRTCKVGSFPPNRLGLYDMHGNVNEWCDDAMTTGNILERVYRSGCWDQGPDVCRAGHRGAIGPAVSSPYGGLRVARVPVGKDTVVLLKKIEIKDLKEPGKVELTPPPQSPFDKLRPEHIPPAQRELTKLDDGTFPEGIVAVLGDGRFNHWAGIGFARFVSEGKTLATWGADLRAQLWEYPSGKLLKRWHALALAASGDGKRLAYYDPDGKIQLWDIAESKVVRTIPFTLPKDLLPQLLLDRAGDTVAVFIWPGGYPPSTKVYRFDEPAKPLFAKSEALVDLAPDGLAVLTVNDKANSLWDVRSGKVIHKLEDPRSDLGRFAPDGKTVALAVYAGTIIWDPATEKVHRFRREGNTHGSFPLAFSADGKRLASGDQYSQIFIYDLVSMQEIKEQKAPSSQGPAPRTFTPDGKKLLYTTGSSGLLRTYDFDAKQSITAEWWVSAGIASGGSLLALRSANLDLSTWKPGSGAQPEKLANLNTDRLYVAADGRYVFSGLGEFRGWDAALRVELAGEFWDKNRRTWHVLSKDGRLVALSKGASVEIWDWAARRLVQNIAKPGETFNIVELSPDATVLATLDPKSRNVVQFWDLASGKPISKLDPPADRTFERIRFSPDGQHVVLTASVGARLIRVVEVAGGKQRIAHDGSVFDVSPDSKTLALAKEGGIRFVDLLTGLPTRADLRLGAPRGMIRELYYTPDGRHLITVNADGTVYVVRLSGQQTAKVSSDSEE